MNKYTDEVSISKRLDRIQKEYKKLSAEARNTLHACHKDHPLGRNQKRSSSFENAWFVLCGRVHSTHTDWLKKVADAFKEVEAESV